MFLRIICSCVMNSVTVMPTISSAATVCVAPHCVNARPMSPPGANRPASDAPPKMVASRSELTSCGSRSKK